MNNYWPALPYKQLEADPYRTFLEWLGALAPLLGNRQMLLNFDEYERLEEMLHENRLDERIFPWLRSLIQNQSSVVVLFSGSHMLEDLNPKWSDALINVRTLRIGQLEEKDAQDLITLPIPDFPLQYAPEAVDRILKASGKKPYLIQVICRDLVNMLNHDARRYATLSDVDRALKSSVQSASAYFNEFWTSIDEAQRALLRILAGLDDEWISEARLRKVLSTRIARLFNTEYT